MAARSITGPRTFYMGLSALIALIAFVGFWPTYFGPLLAGSLDELPLIHTHVVVYVGWLALFATQILLAARGRLDLHVKLGQLGIYYGVLVILVGLLVGFGMFVVRVRAGDAPDAIRRLFGPLLDMLTFAPLFAAAVHYRHRPQLHKRLMIVATTVLLVAAVGRMRAFLLPNVVLVQLVWSSPILLAMIYDYVKYRLVHRVYVLGLAVLLIETPPVRTWLRSSDVWRGFGAWLASAVG